jgi:hypothetical protein
MTRRLSMALMMCTLVLAAGCAQVKPWDRDLLAEYTMRPARDPLATATREHLWFSREAANGGRFIGGGGCGCN